MKVSAINYPVMEANANTVMISTDIKIRAQPV